MTAASRSTLYRKTLYAFLVLAAIQFLSPVSALAAEKAMRWAAVDRESYILDMSPAANNPNVPPPVQFDHFASEVYFDPEDLRNSELTFTAMAVPQRKDPNARSGNQQQEPQGVSGVFHSTSIKQVSGNQFVAEGKLMVAGKEKRMSVPFTASFVKGGKTPRIALEGNFEVQAAEFASGKEISQYPNRIPVRFKITAEPLP